MTNEIMSMDEIVEISQTCSWYYWNLQWVCVCVCVCVFKVLSILWCSQTGDDL
jgi:hypothetical protein